MRKCLRLHSTPPTAQHSTDDRNLVYGAVRSAVQQQQKKKKKKKKKRRTIKIYRTHTRRLYQTSGKSDRVGSGRVCG